MTKITENFWPSGQGTNVAAVHSNIEFVADQLQHIIYSDIELRYIVEESSIGPITIVEESKLSTSELAVYVDIGLKACEYTPIIETLLNKVEFTWLPPEQNLS